MPHKHHSSSDREYGSDESRMDNQNEESYQSNYQYSTRAPPRPGAIVHNNVDMSYSGPPTYSQLPSPRRANPQNNTGSYQSNSQYYYQAPPASAYYSSAPHPGGLQYMNPLSSGHYPYSSFPAYYYPSTSYQYPPTSGEVPVDPRHPNHPQGHPQGSSVVPPPQPYYRAPDPAPLPMTEERACTILGFKGKPERHKFNERFNSLHKTYEEELNAANDRGAKNIAQVKIDELAEAYEFLDRSIPRLS